MGDPIDVVNIILCAIISVLGFKGASKSGMKAFMLIGLAFTIFCVSHIITFAGMQRDLTGFLISIRTIAYILVIVGLSKIEKK
ncbi:MAG: hypothetical protein ABH857_05125 [Elusimicrobiota bacterium]